MSESRNMPVVRRARTRPADADAAKLAHELSNLLDGSLRNLSLVLARLNTPTDEAGDETGPRLRASAEAMKQMALLLRRFMAAGPRDDMAMLHWSDATLGDAVRYAVRLIEPLAATNRIDIDVRLDRLGDVTAGPIYPVVANAVRNAAEAIGAGGRIEIVGRLDGDVAELSVLDDGAGISPHLPRTSEGFVEIGRTTKPGGHGVGLSVAQQIIDDLGGTITLNDRPGGGAIFTARWRPPQED